MQSFSICWKYCTLSSTSTTFLKLKHLRCFLLSASFSCLNSFCMKIVWCNFFWQMCCLHQSETSRSRNSCQFFVSIGINGPKFGNEKRNISWVCLDIKIIFKWSADILFIFLWIPENVCEPAEYVYICIFSPSVTDLYAKNAAQSHYCDDPFCPLSRDNAKIRTLT